MKANVLISSVGRRVGLLNCIRDSFAELGITGRIIAIDVTPYSSGAQFADAFYQVPRCLDPEFVHELENICDREQVDLIVPTIDTELPVYAAARDRFARFGVAICISSPETVAICQDKTLTSEWLCSHHFPIPKQAGASEVLSAQADWTLPLILKPKSGSASIGVQRITSFKELEALTAGNRDGFIVQEFLEGQEFTINVFVSRAGKCVCAIPHLRVEIRAGEVSKGITFRNQRIIDLVSEVVEQLPGAFGALNVQCFLTPCDELKIIEMNARFGGGYPLAHRAGAPITKWLLEEVLGNGARGPFDQWEDGLMMLRYDDAVFVPGVSVETKTQECRAAVAIRR
jgi:carbamoyl-phosphate synthase large subunit